MPLRTLIQMVFTLVAVAVGILVWPIFYDSPDPHVRIAGMALLGTVVFVLALIAAGVGPKLLFQKKYRELLALEQLQEALLLLCLAVTSNDLKTPQGILDCRTFHKWRQDYITIHGRSAIYAAACRGTLPGIDLVPRIYEEQLKQILLAVRRANLL